MRTDCFVLRPRNDGLNHVIATAACPDIDREGMCREAIYYILEKQLS
jgi:hypothetical protein